MRIKSVLSDSKLLVLRQINQTTFVDAFLETFQTRVQLPPSPLDSFLDKSRNSLVASHPAVDRIGATRKRVECPERSRGTYNMPSVYMIRNDRDELYIGASQNPRARLEEHNTERGSSFTKKGKFKIVFEEAHLTLSGARQREIQIKKWRRDKKEMLIRRYQQGLSTKI